MEKDVPSELNIFLLMLASSPSQLLIFCTARTCLVLPLVAYEGRRFISTLIHCNVDRWIWALHDLCTNGFPFYNRIHSRFNFLWAMLYSRLQALHAHIIQSPLTSISMNLKSVRWRRCGKQHYIQQWRQTKTGMFPWCYGKGLMRWCFSRASNEGGYNAMCKYYDGKYSSTLAIRVSAITDPTTLSLSMRRLV